MSNEITNSGQFGYYTLGCDLVIHNLTPFKLERSELKYYQVECEFPNIITPDSSIVVRIEHAWVTVVEKDDRAHAIYTMQTLDGKKQIAFRCDEDTGAFNIWVDMCYQMGNLTMKDEVKRKDLSWVHDGTVEFYLFYNELTDEFSITRPNPMKCNDDMYIGYYTLDIGFFEHTYAFMVQEDQKKVNFQCSGGMNGNNNVYPAQFYNPNETRTGREMIRCNASIARTLAAWDDHIDWSRTDYNRGKKWKEQGGDNSGLVYGVTGVCHQMCNTILCAIQPDEPLNAYISVPPSFSVSRFFFKALGSGAQRGYCISQMVQKAYRYSENKTEANRLRLENTFKLVKNMVISDLRAQLSGDKLEQHCISAVREAIGEKLDALSPSTLEEIISINIECLHKKNEFDNRIIRAEIAPQQYAADVNAEVDKMAVNLEKHKLLNTGKAHHNLINPTFIPDFSELRKILF